MMRRIFFIKGNHAGTTRPALSMPHGRNVHGFENNVG
jgi:hypothetical protein